MDPINLAGVLILDGQGYATPADACDAAATWLTGQGVSAWDVDTDRPTMNPQRAWYDDAGAQFVQADHTNARAVTVVHLSTATIPA